MIGRQDAKPYLLGMADAVIINSRQLWFSAFQYLVMDSGRDYWTIFLSGGLLTVDGYVEEHHCPQWYNRG